MCGAHAAVRHLLGEVHEPDVITIIDMEAGLEHLSRGTDRHVDVLLAVAEPYFKALETARRCVELGRELKIPRVAAVANKFRSAGDLQAVRKYATTHEIPLLGEVPYEEKIQNADLSGAALALGEPNAAVTAVERIALELGF
jgi:CO dehydrogenase maturation factor